MPDVVVIRPNGDAVEGTLSVWVDLLLPPGIGLPGVNVVTDLSSPTTATAAATQAACGTGDVILYFGHGSEDSLGDPKLVDTTTIASASGRTVVAIACLSAETLGPDAVSSHNIKAYLGFSEPLFVYNASPALFGFEIARRLASYLAGVTTLSQAQNGMAADLQVIEALYHTGASADHIDAPMIWMGARMNWRGLQLS
jgi:hypothetical protein